MRAEDLKFGKIYRVGSGLSNWDKKYGWIPAIYLGPGAVKGSRRELTFAYSGEGNPPGWATSSIPNEFTLPSAAYVFEEL